MLPVCVTNEENGSSLDDLALLDSDANTHLLSQRLYTQLGLHGNPIKSNLQLADGSVKILDAFETKCLVRGVKEITYFTLEGFRFVDRLPNMCGSRPALSDLTDSEYLLNVGIPIMMRLHRPFDWYEFFRAAHLFRSTSGQLFRVGDWKDFIGLGPIWLQA